MALIMVRHEVRRPIGETRQFLSRLAASGGTMLVRVRISDGVERAHPVTIDRRLPLDPARAAWSVAWNARPGIPGTAGTLSVAERHDGTALLEFSGAYSSPGYVSEKASDVFAFRRASALARAYLEALGESVTSAIAA